MPRQHGQYSDSLGAGRFWDRIPGWTIFFAPVQTGPEVRLPPMQWVDCRSFPRVKRLGRGINLPSPSYPAVKQRVELGLFLYAPSFIQSFIHLFIVPEIQQNGCRTCH
jgi:hypothetical protein